MPSLAITVTACVLTFYGAGLVLEREAAARPLPQVPGWNQRALVAFCSTMAIGAVLPLTVAHLLAGHAPLDLAWLGTAGGATAAIVAADFVAYWLHRAQHQVDCLWRYTHQMHHAAERVDVLGAAFFHPLDIALGSLLTSAVVAALGLSEGAIVLASVVTLLLGVLQHLNVRTPPWLGYLVQRPESHSLHHLRGFHRDNYGNLALWDMAFGTFHNPVEFETEAGFFPGASAQVRDLLLGRDLAKARP